MNNSGDVARNQSSEVSGVICSSGAITGVRVGVSVSRNPFLLKKLRVYCKIFARVSRLGFRLINRPRSSTAIELSFIYPFHVAFGTGIHFNNIALFNECRHFDVKSGL